MGEDPEEEPVGEAKDRRDTALVTIGFAQAALEHGDEKTAARSVLAATRTWPKSWNALAPELQRVYNEQIDALLAEEA